MAKLRLGCLPLRIETGRYSRPRLDERDRTCLLCTPVEINGEVRNHLIENEIHFLFHCSAYERQRAQWFQEMDLPSSFKDLEVDQKLKVVLNNPECVKKNIPVYT